MAPVQVPPPLWLLVVLSALSVLPINMFVPSLPNIAAALTVAGAGFVAFLAGLIVDASNANLAVLAVMLAVSVLSLVVAMAASALERRPVPVTAAAR